MGDYGDVSFVFPKWLDGRETVRKMDEGGREGGREGASGDVGCVDIGF